MTKQRPPEYCPECGAEVPPAAAACPSCGSDAQTGWSDHAQENRLGIPSDDFDYEAFVSEEFPTEPRRRTRGRGINSIWRIVAVVLLLLLLYFWWPR